jgi:hypothetical protein
VGTLDVAQTAEAGTLPRNVRATGYLPLDLVLPSCSAVVHHGGGGTFTTAVAERVPQLITPCRSGERRPRLGTWHAVEPGSSWKAATSPPPLCGRV